MSTFVYRGFDQAGRAARGMIEALDPKEARERLTQRGVLAERLEAVSGRTTARCRGHAFPIEQRAMIYRELAALLRAGLPLVSALDILIESPDQQEQAGLLAGVRDRIREGASLAESLSAATPVVSHFERAVMASGVRAGNLDDILDQLAGYLDDQVRLREGIQSALLYPVLVISLAILIGIGMMGFVLPSLTRMFEEGRLPLPALTRGLLWMADHTLTLGLPILVILLAAGWSARRRLRSDRAFAIRWERSMDRVPVLRRAFRLLCGLRFTRTLAVLLRGGVPLVDGLDLAGEATGSRWVADDIKRGAEEVRHGRAVSQVIRAVPPLGDTLPGWFQAGEASGDLAGLLEQAARRFQVQWEHYLNRVLKLVEPLLILAVGVFVLLMALAILLPILSLNRAVF